MTDQPDISYHVGIGRSPDGGGTLSISPLNADAVSTTDIVLTYKAIGKMEVGAQVEITVPADGDWPSPSDIGRTEVNTGSLSTTDTKMTATTSVVLNKDDLIVFTYKNVTVPAEGRTYTFTGQSRSDPDTGGLAPLSTGGATIDIDEVAAGSVMLTNMAGDVVDSAAPGAMLGDLTFTFEAEEDMAANSQVSIKIENLWTPPFRGNNAADAREGAIWVEGATVGIDPAADEAGPWTITATLESALADGGTFTFTYRGTSHAPVDRTYLWVRDYGVSRFGRHVT